MSPDASPPGTRSQAERTIAAARVVLAVFSLAAVWFDPAEPARFAATTYSLHLSYLAYSLLLGLFTWQRAVGARLAAATHVADIAIFSVFQYLTLGPSSPFFVYFIFSLFFGRSSARSTFSCRLGCSCIWADTRSGVGWRCSGSRAGRPRRVQTAT
jgi:hypothetical protein